ncbi:FAD-binding oxidoreductase [Marinobacter sp. M1N3S26]|uniref:FAD-binding oxidoreductase n=1 Tax=Marinobacter sp. M1N3S26 TaxID=3382299 RepID=UPI00387AC32D
MTTESDLFRARQATRQAMTEVERLDQRQFRCGDEALRSTLHNIGQRKSEQTWRMLAWLQHHEQHSIPISAPDPGQPDMSGHESDTGQPDTPAPDARHSDQGEWPPSGNGDVVPVIERRQVTPDLIVFRVSRPAGFEFSPGQSVKVGLGDLRRSYSIVSAPHEPFLELFVELTPGGRMSERLRGLQVGDSLALGTPKGGLRFDNGVRNHLMIATVTGINPFISMVRDYLHRGKQGHQMLLMHGASYQDEFGYREELETLADAHPDLLTYLPTVSRPDEPRNQGWTGHTGRVDSLVDDVLEHHGLGPRDTRVYACGHSGMLEAVAGQVQPRGFRLETESYD